MENRPLTTTIKSEDGDRVYCEHQPGNMTKYIGMAFKVPKAVPYYRNSWCVCFPDHGSSYFIDEGQFISVGYVAEKFGRGRVRELDTSSPDIHEMTKMIALMVPNVTHNARTDEHGYLPSPP